MPDQRKHFTRIDGLLLLMTVIWGTNYSIVKAAFSEIDPQAFNAARMIVASGMFLATILVFHRAPARVEADDPAAHAGHSLASIFHTPAALTLRDWAWLAGLGVVGHFAYQYCFIGGLARTSVANSSLMLAATPVVIALLSAMLGQERVSRLHWIGAGLSVLGIYVIVGHGVSFSEDALIGDMLMLVAVCCWAVYTIAARPLMMRHSPVGVTGLSMAIGTALYVPVTWSSLRAVPWEYLGAGTWVALTYSAIFALCVAYTIWYTAVRQIGSARTSVYSNFVPLVAMLTAVVFLGEPLGASQLFGAGAVLVGVALTRGSGGSGGFRGSGVHGGSEGSGVQRFTEVQGFRSFRRSGGSEGQGLVRACRICVGSRSGAVNSARGDRRSVGFWPFCRWHQGCAQRCDGRLATDRGFRRVPTLGPVAG